jgi:uncharacterized protein YqhQ
MPRWYRLLAIAGFLLALGIGFADEVHVIVNISATTTTTTTIPSYGLRATMLAIAQINPVATLILLLMPVIIGEFLIKNFEEIKANEPLKAFIRLMILIIALALFATIF